MKIVNEADEVLTAMRGIVSAPLPLQVLLQTGPEHLTSCELKYEKDLIHMYTMYIRRYTTITYMYMYVLTCIHMYNVMLYT